VPGEIDTVAGVDDLAGDRGATRADLHWGDDGPDDTLLPIGSGPIDHGHRVDAT
jgi:hypothetical protein